MDGFCFVIYDETAGKIIDIELYQTSESDDGSLVTEALEKAVFKKDLLGRPVQSVRLIICNRYNTIVPDEVFEAEQADTYLRFCHTLPQDYTIRHEALPSLAATNVYAFSTPMENAVRKLWPDLTLTHLSTLFLENILQEARSYEENCAFVYVSNGFFELAVVQDQRLTFFNNFKFNTKDDFVYYLMFALEQQGLGMDLPVYFMGLITGHSEIIQLCERYLKHIRFVKPNGSVEVDMSLSSIPFQYYYIPYKSLA